MIVVWYEQNLSSEREVMSKRDEFFQIVDAKYARRSQAHTTMLDRILESELIFEGFRFNSKTNPTYHVCLKLNPDCSILWISANGKIYVRWYELRKNYGREIADPFVNLWVPNFKDRNIVDAFGDGGELSTPLTDKLVGWVYKNCEQGAQLALTSKVS